MLVLIGILEHLYYGVSGPTLKSLSLYRPIYYVLFYSWHCYRTVERSQYWLWNTRCKLYLVMESETAYQTRVLNFFRNKSFCVY